MAAPKAILKEIYNIQRIFLWSGVSDQRKWALVMWDMVCKPNSHGGLGLCDPIKMNLISGVEF